MFAFVIIALIYIGFGATCLAIGLHRALKRKPQEDF